MYCGNNGNNRDLLNGNKVLGTPYQCLKKGIGQGLNMPCDREYKGEYIPIDDFKIYCGQSRILPRDYDRIGSSAQCLAKGVGIGKVQKANSRRCNPRGGVALRFGMGGDSRNVVRFWLIYFSISIPISIYLYLATPSYLKKSVTVNNITTEKRDLNKVVPLSIVINIVIYIVLTKILK